MNNSDSAIDSAGRRIIRTMDLILNMSDLQTGSYTAHIETIDIDQKIISPLVKEFSNEAENKQLRLIYEKRTDNTVIDADEFSIHHSIGNLIDNAVKYTSKGEVTVTLDRDSVGRLTVRIQDTGVGISQDFMKNLFIPFTQEETGYTRKYEGNGLGLALVKKYCELNKADVLVESIKGQGTTFTLIFNKI